MHIHFLLIYTVSTHFVLADIVTERKLESSISSRAKRGGKRCHPKVFRDRRIISLRKEDHMKELIERIKSEVSLVSICSEYGSTPIRAGENYRCICPFHPDGDPSFVIYTKTNKYQCFGRGCGLHGDVIDYVARMDGLSTKDAIKKLAARIGIDLPAQGHTEGREASSGALRILDDATDFFHFLLKDRIKERELQIEGFLAKRGIAPSSLEKFRVGYATSSPALITHLTKNTHYSEVDLMMAGLAMRTEAGILYSFFRNRIIFPFLRDGKAFYMTGRSLDKTLPKYLNLPTSDQFKKDIFNPDALRSSSKEILLTEGIIDCVLAEQYGYPAISLAGMEGGDGLSKRLRDKKAYIVFDNEHNGAGQAGAVKLASTLSRDGVEARIVTLPRKEGVSKVDLADFLKAEGTDAFSEAVRSSQSLIDIKINEATKQANLGRIDFIREKIVPLLCPPSIGEMDLARYLDTMKTKLSLNTDMYLSLKKEVARARKSFPADKPIDLLSSGGYEMTLEEEAQVLAYLKDPGLMGNLAKDIRTIGVVGEDINAMALYLFSLTRKTEKPISAVVFGDSSSGKSHLVNSICSLLPEEDQMVLSSASAKSFEYGSEKQLKHKVIVVQESEGMADVEPTIRLMQSEGKLARYVTVKNEETGLSEATYRSVECPACIITTTTRDRVHPENSTRIFELYVNPSPEQTALIHELAREKVTVEWLAKKKEIANTQALHKAIQRFIPSVNVVIPFSEHIDFPKDSVRSRRDFPRFLDLIKSVALFRQFQKAPKKHDDGTDYIEADIEDYRVAFELGKKLFASTFSPISDRAKDVLRVCLAIEAEGFTRADVKKKAREMKIHVPENGRSLADQLRSLEEADAIKCIEGGKGKTYTYAKRIEKLEDLDQANISVIPTPEQITRRLSPETETAPPYELENPSLN
jgi:DNA primase catalytic core